eukprot:7382144-Prymnesium_polylepis.1
MPADTGYFTQAWARTVRSSSATRDAWVSVRSDLVSRALWAGRRAVSVWVNAIGPSWCTLWRDDVDHVPVCCDAEKEYT